ncbi:MAG: 23S rRNA (uracil(1939)-C(5))-methyltransferase RlmD [Betaproteobacteria bacterium]|nr:23S rRNA (uracil(1939)-C(5))-methyltransferase RlmD [Betaproteobacteria bacterium]
MSNTIRVESLDQEGRGVAHADGKVIFIQGALPGELVTYASFVKKPSYELAQVGQVIEAAPMRATPRCPHFGLCGGCSQQHFDARAQVAAKQRVLEDNLKHIGKVTPGSILPAIYGEPWGYRHRARFSARYVPKKGGALIGFREKRSSYVTDMTTCEVIPPRISALLVPLRGLIGGLSRPERMPQIELAIGVDTDALVLRILEPLSSADEVSIRDFADQHRVQFFVQPRGPDTAVPFYPPHDGVLYYTLPEFDLELGFSPTEFTQVNAAVNVVLVRRAMTLLAPQPGERIADMFCGLGNFTLAIARSGASVLGIEGARSLVERAQSNALRNGLSVTAEFRQADLFKIDQTSLPQLGRFDKMLIDPPRDGAVALINALSDDVPRRIVYVSCNAATLARDAGVLVHVKGYALTAAGVVNMFPHTSHVESIAVFDKNE